MIVADPFTLPSKSCVAESLFLPGSLKYLPALSQIVNLWTHYSSSFQPGTKLLVIVDMNL